MSVERRRRAGFTLMEVVLGGATLLVAVGAILGAYIGQMTLNEHARNLSLAIQDANRIMEQIRVKNTTSTCTSPDARPPSPYQASTWDAWLQDPAVGGGKSIPTDPSRNAEERIVVTCQNSAGTQYCNSAQGGDWQVSATPTFPVIRVTVGVCWRHRERTIGECSWNGTSFDLGPDTNGNGVIDGPAVLTTLITCRQ